MASAAALQMRWPSVSPPALSVDRTRSGADVKDKVDMSAFSSNDQLADAAPA
jgi:hypothetical protein